MTFQETSSRFDVPLRTFHIASELCPLTSDDPGSCWNEIVGNSTIATGFPIPERSNNEKGLELPLEVMAGLGGVPLATRFHNAYILTGRCIAFVPVARNGDSVQWHVLKNGQATIRYEDIASLCPVRLPAEILNEEDLLSTRTFLGWCSESMNHLGASSLQSNSIGFSNAKSPAKLSVKLTSGSVGFGKIGTGQLTFSFGKHSGSFTSEKPNYYLETLDYAKQIHVILQDTAHRRAWLTDGERAILHIIFHAQRMGSCGIGGKDIELQGADPKSQSSVRAAMVANANVVVRRDYCMGKDEVGTQRFKDLVGDLYSRLEVCQANAKGETGAGIELKMSRKRQIRGYEFMDLVTKRREMFLKEFNLRRAVEIGLSSLETLTLSCF